jgi:glucokinase
MLKAIGVDIGGTNIRVACVTSDGLIKAARTVATPRTADKIMATIIEIVAELNADHTAAAIGVGIPARVDVAKGEIFPGGFIDLSTCNFTHVIKQKTGLKVFIDNDASMALMGEARIGAARGLSHVVLLTIGTGIGGAVMAGGRILHGRATAGQLGHVTVNYNGGQCRCGRTGCVETTSSGTALRDLIVAAGLPASTVIADLLAAEDQTAKTVLRAWSLPLRSALDSLIASFDPQRIVLGGGLGADAICALADVPARSEWFQCDVVRAQLGDTAGVIGAALASMETAS